MSVTMPSDNELDRYIAAAAGLLDLPVRDEWLPAVRENLAVTLRLAAVVSAFPLPDETESAPVYQP
jgi:hypothetical protein